MVGNMTTQTAIPVFKFGSKELAQFKAQFMVQQELDIEHTRFNFTWDEILQFKVADTVKRMVWAVSNIHYIVDHGSFRTLEKSVSYQQHTISMAIEA